MKLTGLFIVCVSCFASNAFADATHWGAKINLTTEVSLDDAIKNFDPKATDVLIKGKAQQVCQKKGCWLTLASDKSDVRVTFLGYKFFVPFSLKDKEIRVQGTLKQETISVKDQQHFLKDEGRPQADIDAITGPKSVYTVVASGVEQI